MRVREIKIEDFGYDLPEDRIAGHPLQKRDACKLLLVAPNSGIYHCRFHELPGLIPPGSVLVCNDTKVIHARIKFRKATGARVEVFLLEPVRPADYALMFQVRRRCVWRCLVGNLKKWKGEMLEMELGGGVRLHARRMSEDEIRQCFPHETGKEGELIEFFWSPPEIPFASVVEKAGRIPIPPYLNRDSEETDEEDYQTVYAFHEGSVAAPTAGLHFTPSVFEDLKAHNIPVEKLTLHVGAGTFKPVKSEKIGDHPMHTETFTITPGLIETLLHQKREGKPVIAVGTTTVRTLESLPMLGEHIMRGEAPHVSQWEAYEDDSAAGALRDSAVESLQALKNYMEKEGIKSLTASTSIMIAPGFRWRITDGMVTNFHQPHSTLLLLVSSFLMRHTGDQRFWRRVYEEALRSDYRFLSYGDAQLLL